MASLLQTAKTLTQMKQRIKEISEQRIRVEALKDQAFKRIKEMGYNSIEEAEEALEDLSQELTEQEAKLEDMVAKLQEDYPEL